MPARLILLTIILAGATGCEQKGSTAVTATKTEKPSEAALIESHEAPVRAEPPTTRGVEVAPPPSRRVIPNTNLVTRLARNEPGNPPQTNSTSLPRPVANVLEAQIALARAGISCGSLDGIMGNQTRAALQAFQKSHELTVTGNLDETTRSALILQSNAFVNFTITREYLNRLQPLSETWLGKSRQSALDYTNILELVAEKSKAHPNLLKQLNPKVQWDALKDSDTVIVPSADYPSGLGKAARVRISLGQRTLEAFDSEENLLAHFPCSIARMAEKRPVGELHVSVVVPNPNYTFDPALFAESPEAKILKTKLVLPPGPNNPVGTVWIGLDRPGYGMHGTPNPEQVGRTESHGCFRLANWNAEILLSLITLGTPVEVEL